MFLADLVRSMAIDAAIDFMAISSYSSNEATQVRIVKDLEHDILGRDVVIVEDIVDTGLTLTYLRRSLMERDPRCPLQRHRSTRKARPGHTTERGLGKRVQPGLRPLARRSTSTKTAPRLIAVRRSHEVRDGLFTVHRQRRAQEAVCRAIGLALCREAPAIRDQPAAGRSPPPPKRGEARRRTRLPVWSSLRAHSGAPRPSGAPAPGHPLPGNVPDRSPGRGGPALLNP